MEFRDFSYNISSSSTERWTFRGRIRGGNPTVSEQVVVSKIPEVPAMELIQEQIVESIKEVPQERVQQRTVDQIVRVPVPTVQEHRFVTEIPRAQVVKRIRGNIVRDHSTGACSAHR